MDFKSLEENYQTDEKKSTEGIEIVVGINALEQPITMIVAQAGNPKHREIQRKYEAALERARKSEKKRTLVMAKITAESILKNWHGVLDSEKNEIPYTVDVGTEALIRYEQLFLEILEASNNPSNFGLEEIEEIEETEKNSLTS